MPDAQPCNDLLEHLATSPRALGLALLLLFAPNNASADGSEPAMNQQCTTAPADQAIEGAPTSKRPPPPAPAPPTTRDAPPPAPPSASSSSSSKTRPASQAESVERTTATATSSLSPAQLRRSELKKTSRRTTPEAIARRRGGALLGGAATSLVASLGLGLVALRSVDRRCLRSSSVSAAAEGGSESPGEAAARSIDLCMGEHPGIVASGLTSGLTLAASIGLATGGGWHLRPDISTSTSTSTSTLKARRARFARLSIGSLLLPLGVATVLSSRLALRVDDSCVDHECFRAARTSDLILRTLGGITAASGGALLGSIGKSTPKRYARVTPTIGLGAGISVYGAF